jgi:hypothetical protein
VTGAARLAAALMAASLAACPEPQAPPLTLSADAERFFVLASPQGASEVFGATGVRCLLRDGDGFVGRLTEDAGDRAGFLARGADGRLEPLEVVVARSDGPLRPRFLSALRASG